LAEVEVEHTDFVVVPVRDMERAMEFYGGTLGLETRSERGGRIDWIEYETGNLTLALMAPEQLGREFAPNPWPIALRVPDVDKSRARLEAAGVEFQGEMIDSGVCRMIPFRDPDGNQLMLHRRYAPVE
jgi:predicted enzyme related to lactoylglutathione lyase